MSETTRKVNLLSDTELEEIYAQPAFNEVERSLYFDFSTEESKIAQTYGTVKARVSFLLTLGYFKANQQLYCPDLTNSEDTRYIISEYFPGKLESLDGKIDARLYRKQKSVVLKLCNYRDWSADLKNQTNNRLIKLLRYYPKPHSALRQLLTYLENQNIVTPSYRKLQDMFTKAFAEEEKRLDQIIKAVPKQTQNQLTALIQRKNGISQLPRFNSIKQQTYKRT